MINLLILGGNGDLAATSFDLMPSSGWKFLAPQKIDIERVSSQQHLFFRRSRFYCYIFAKYYYYTAMGVETLDCH